MSALRAVQNFLFAKEIKGHIDTVKSVDEYANKVKNQAKSKTGKVNLAFFENKEIAKSVVAMEKFRVRCKAAQKEAIVWPNSTRNKDLDLLASTQKRFGFKHRRRTKALKEFISAEKKFGRSLKLYWVGWKIVGELYKVNGKRMVLAQSYARHLQKTLDFLVDWTIKTPVKISGGDSATLFVLARQVGKLASAFGDVAGSLKKIKKINDQTIKECAQMIKRSQEWVIWGKNMIFAEKDSALKKSVRAGSPKK